MRKVGVAKDQTTAAQIRWPGQFVSNYREARFLWATHQNAQTQVRVAAAAGAAAFALSIVPELGQPWSYLWRWQLLPRVAVLCVAMALVFVPNLSSRPDRMSRTGTLLAFVVAAALSVTMSTSPVPIQTTVVVMLTLTLVLILFVPIDPRLSLGPTIAVPLIVLSIRRDEISDLTFFIIDSVIVLGMTAVLAVALATRLRTSQRTQFASLRAESHARRQAESATQELRRLFDATPAPMVVVDFDEGRILRTNGDFERIFQVPSDADRPLLAQRFYRDPQERERLLKVLNTTRRAELSVHMQTYDGEPLHGVVTVYPIEYDGKPARIASFRDTSQQQRTEDALRDAKEQAEAASRLKTQFLAHMSHEIRTPMNGVLGSAWLLETSELQAEQAELVTTMRKSGEGLLRIIDDILDITKVEAGELSLRYRPFEVSSLVECVRAPLEVRAKEQHLRFRVRVGPKVPQGLLGDEGRLAQIIINLAGNAIKFTDKGSVEVQIKTAGTTKDGKIRLHVDVIDTGAGIKTDEIPTLFQPFVQADSSHARQHGGTGLGLAISRRLVELMKGRIDAESTIGKGSRFWFEVPLEASDVPRTITIPTVPPPLPPDIRILVAEDNRVNQLVAQRMLQRLGVSNHIVSDGREAIEALKSERFDLILMDVQMPEVDGLEATRWLRKFESDNQIERTPVIAMTAHALAGDRQWCLESGMDDYASKPLSPKQLQEVLGRWVMNTQDV